MRKSWDIASSSCGRGDEAMTILVAEINGRPGSRPSDVSCLRGRFPRTTKRQHHTLPPPPWVASRHTRRVTRPAGMLRAQMEPEPDQTLIRTSFRPRTCGLHGGPGVWWFWPRTHHQLVFCTLRIRMRLPWSCPPAAEGARAAWLAPMTQEPQQRRR